MKEWRLKSESDTDEVYAEYENDEETGNFRYVSKEALLRIPSAIADARPDKVSEPAPEPPPKPAKKKRFRRKKG